ncbi:cobalt transporter ATP-binding subunit [Mycoplasmopsis canis PG 14]|uniref:Energy-coupling factor transporter ATP-binding protein EcfA2 n=1 Tax=Mycoplasmopsis canis TaxID=29555 RepID=A0A449AS83_9BACT|nr:energy-coupling factor transporter ATPase [Mycoplasmopsis canis]AMD81569.1 energy-coupling factor transporter ATPase [Mycoplasmopsis canis PG 14]EIE39413.1 cobalt transporter ATP-binding subunit [Mycoplasmopsis canis PG 14]VEU69202.1 ABC transporter ATP-binding protein [Mycoplasmopsis canis]
MQIKINNLKHVFNKNSPWEFLALDGINLNIKDGEYIGVIGATGSGKTTLIEHFNGLLRATNGNIEWDFIKDNIQQKFIYGETKSKFKIKDLRKKIGIVFQFAEYQLFKNTIKEDIAFGPIAFGVPKDEAYKIARECLLEVGLSEDYLERSPFELSGGQKRRVAIAGILAMNPDFMVFDEPTAGLDPVGVKDILDILTNLHKSGKTIINVTHDLDHVLERAERVIMLKKGKIVADNNAYDVLSDIHFLRENHLQPPQLLDFVLELREKGINVPKVRNIEELAHFLNNEVLTKEGK